MSVHEDIAPANRQSHHEPLLRLAIGKVEQRRGGILREVGDSCFHDGPLLARDDPGDALALLLGHPFQRLHLVCCRVLERAGDDTFFANSELHEEGRLHAGGLGSYRRAMLRVWPAGCERKPDYRVGN